MTRKEGECHINKQPIQWRADNGARNKPKWDFLGISAIGKSEVI
jgi:hypothetical protein